MLEIHKKIWMENYFNSFLNCENTHVTAWNIYIIIYYIIPTSSLVKDAPAAKNT